MSRRRKTRTPTRAFVQSAVDALPNNDELTEAQAAAYFRAVLRAELRVCREDLASKDLRRLVRAPGDRRLLALLSLLERLERRAAS